MVKEVYGEGNKTASLLGHHPTACAAGNKSAFPRVAGIKLRARMSHVDTDISGDDEEMGSAADGFQAGRRCMALAKWCLQSTNQDGDTSYHTPPTLHRSQML